MCLDAHLFGEPFLHLPAVGFHQGLILTPGLVQHTVQVHTGLSVHLHVEAVSQLAAQGVDFLIKKRGKFKILQWILVLSLRERNSASDHF
jgi:hypothetical protein